MTDVSESLLPSLSKRGDPASDPFAQPVKTFTYKPQKAPRIEELLLKWLNPFGWIDALFDAITACWVYIFMHTLRKL